MWKRIVETFWMTSMERRRPFVVCLFVFRDIISQFSDVPCLSSFIGLLVPAEILESIGKTTVFRKTL